MFIRLMKKKKKKETYIHTHTWHIVDVQAMPQKHTIKAPLDKYF